MLACHGRPYVGRWRPMTRRTEVTAKQLEARIAELRATRDSLIRRPVEEIVEVLGSVGERFLEDSDPIRKRALAALPEEARLSSAMAAEVLDGMARDWSRNQLKRTVRAEFGDPAALDGFQSVQGRSVAGIGPRLCVQVVSGSVPGVGVNALIRSLLVKSPTLLKPGFGDTLLPKLFVEALAEVDSDLTDSVAIVEWRGGSEILERIALSAAEVAVVYGSDETVAALRALAPPTTRVLGYHHRVAACVIGRDLETAEIESVSDQVARAIAMFEQRGCVCPHVVYVEDPADGGTGLGVSAEKFAESLARSLRALEEVLPAIPLEVEEGGSLQQLRGAAEMHAASGEGSLHHGGAQSSWTVIGEGATQLGPPTAHRGVRVRRMADIGELGRAIGPLSSHLQTIGHAGLGDRLESVALMLGRLGASRIVPIQDMSFPPPWWLQDGRGPLRDLVRWTEIADLS